MGESEVVALMLPVIDGVSDELALVDAEALGEVVTLLLADVEGFSYKEIADMLGLPIGTVMSRLHRGRKAMHKQLYEFAMERGLVDRGSSTPAETPS